MGHQVDVGTVRAMPGVTVLQEDQITAQFKQQWGEFVAIANLDGLLEYCGSHVNPEYLITHFGWSKPQEMPKVTPKTEPAPKAEPTPKAKAPDITAPKMEPVKMEPVTEPALEEEEVKGINDIETDVTLRLAETSEPTAEESDNRKKRRKGR
jgi:hypothetical protein